jgi:NAD(P)-dependent dehydrogenase (short-subunit alcohol dehydrogenase family)
MNLTLWSLTHGSGGGGVDYLFHVAGGSQHAAAEDTTDEVDRDMFELNTMSAIAITKAILPSMLARRSAGGSSSHGGGVNRRGVFLNRMIPKLPSVRWLLTRSTNPRLCSVSTDFLVPSSMKLLARTNP